jgi:hypothetical protein
MPNRHSCVIIVLFWTGMMAWYAHREVVPSWLQSSPADYRAVVPSAAQDGRVGWLLFGDERFIGRAETEVTHRENGSILLHSQARFTELPVRLGSSDAGTPGLNADALFEVDPTRDLSGFRITLTFDSGLAPIQVTGSVKDQQLGVVFETGSRRYELPRQYYPRHRLIGDVLSPVDRLPPLRTGQTWTMALVNPLTNQVGTVQAEVQGKERLSWGGRSLETLVVQFKGGGFHARAWVRPNGVVLKQEMTLLWTTLTFVREVGSEPAGLGPARREDAPIPLR